MAIKITQGHVFSDKWKDYEGSHTAMQQLWTYM